MADFQALRARVDFSEVEKAREKFGELKNEIPGAGAAVETFGDVVKALENPLMAVATALAAATAGAIALGFKAIEAGDKLNDMSTRTGKTTEYLQALGDVAEKSGSNLDTLVDALDQVRKKSTASDEEGKKVAAAYKYLGIEARDASGHLKDAADIASEGAEALIKMGNSADATAAFQDAFGASALKVLPTLKDLNEEVDKQYDFLASVGALMDSNLAKASDDYNDRMHDLGSVFKGLGQDIARIMLPALTGLADMLINSAKNSGVLGTAFELLKGVVWVVIQAVKVLETVFISLDTAFAEVVQSITLGGKVLWAAMTGNWDQIPKLWDDYKNRIVQTNKDGAEAVSKIWSTVDAAPVSKEDFKKNKNPAKGGTYNPYNDDKSPKVQDSDILKDLLSQDKAISKLKGDYDELFGAVKRVHQEQTEADIASGKYNAQYNKKKELIKEAATEEQLASLRSKAASQDELELRNKLEKSRLAAAEAINKAKKSSDAEIASNRIRIQLSKQFGMTQDDVNAAIAEYNLRMAEKALADAIDNNLSEEKLIKLRAEVALMREKKNTADQVNSDNKADAGPQTGIEGFTNGWTQAFAQYKKDAQDTATVGAQAFKSASGAMGDAFAEFVTTGKMNFKSLAASILSDLARILAQKAIVSAISLFKNGGAFSGGTQFFADGGVVSSPTAFAMTGGKMGVMGEAGPEAIMPLKRGPDGKLGVASAGGSGGMTQVNNTIQINIDSVDSNDRVAQLRQEVMGSVEALTKKTMAKEMRKGGMLNPVAAR